LKPIFEDYIMRKLHFALAIIVQVVATTANADDWPQWMGPRRDNVWRENGLLDKFPTGGPPIVWRAPVAGGYAGPAVVDGLVFVTDYVTTGDVKTDNVDRKEFTGTERVLCLDEKTGKERWKREYPVKYTISYPAGPRCTPLVDGDRLYTLGAEGNLFCFEAKTGRIVWQKDLPKEYRTKTAMWGYAGHPLIDGDKLFCIAGGPGSHAVALDKNTGSELWRSLTSPEQGYSPPKLIEAGGRRQLILARIDALSSVDPETGREYWSVPYEATSGSLIMSPARSTDYLFIGGFSKKNLLVKLASDSPAAEIVWRDKPQHGLSAVNVQPFVLDGIMYGFDESGWMYAVELPSGKRIWETTKPVSRRPANSATAFIVRHGDEGNRFWLFNDSGDLIIARLTPAGYEEIDRTHIIDPTNAAFGRDVVWCMPAFANRRMYVRNDNECVCVDLSKK
jgi:outer membrane protein assembly factor BamB